MPYYTISYNQTDENVGNGFNREIISHQLREEAGYDGVVCTDWIITGARSTQASIPASRGVWRQ